MQRTRLETSQKKNINDKKTHEKCSNLVTKKFKLKRGYVFCLSNWKTFYFKFIISAGKGKMLESLSWYNPPGESLPVIFKCSLRHSSGTNLAKPEMSIKICTPECSPESAHPRVLTRAVLARITVSAKAHQQNMGDKRAARRAKAATKKKKFY